MYDYLNAVSFAFAHDKVLHGQQVRQYSDNHLCVTVPVRCGVASDRCSEIVLFACRISVFIALWCAHVGGMARLLRNHVQRMHQTNNFPMKSLNLVGLRANFIECHSISDEFKIRFQLRFVLIVLEGEVL